MPEGNRYAAALDPQGAGPPAGGPPQMPQQGPPGPPGQPQDASGSQGQPPADPALVEALSILQGHQGRIADLLKDPTSLQHVRVVFEAVKREPVAIQALTQAGIGPEKLQLFEQMLAQAEQGGQGGERDDRGRPAPHWLAGR